MACHFLLFALALLLTACAGVPKGDRRVGEVVTQKLNPTGTVLAILTRQGGIYRLYLEGRKPRMAPWEMVRTTQLKSAPRLVWWPSGTAALENACGGTFDMPHAQERYPVPNAEQGPGIGISNKECFP